MLRYAEIGTVSHGTLRDEDLMDAFLGELNWQIARQDRTPEDREQLDRLTNLHDRIQEEFYDEEGSYSDPQSEAFECINES